MKSATLFSIGAGSLVGSFGVPALSLPLQVAAFGLFVASEVAYRHEEQHIRPMLARKYKAWEEVLDHAYEHQTGAAQAYAINQVDWRYQQRNQQLNLTGSVRQQYLNLFTVGRAAAAAPAQTVDVTAAPVPTPPDRPDRPAAPDRTKRAEPNTPPLDLARILNAPFVFIYGAQGSGKTALAKQIAKLREASGHAITVADPHGSKLEWGDWRLVGAGRNFGALNGLLGQFDDGVTADYEEYAEGKRDFAFSTLVIDEFTQWADKCPKSAAFVKSACSDIRKIAKCVLIVSHSRTLTGLGGADGLRKSIDNSAIMVELEATENEKGEPIPTGYGWLEYPGKERVRVRVPFDDAQPTDDRPPRPEPPQRGSSTGEASPVRLPQEPQVEADPVKKHWDRFTPEYVAFIKSPEWEAKRAERISLDTVNGRVICQLCRKPCTEDDPPEVDHVSYPMRGASVEDFVNQPISDLRTLHRSCHKFRTDASRRAH